MHFKCIKYWCWFGHLICEDLIYWGSVRRSQQMRWSKQVLLHLLKILTKLWSQQKHQQEQPKTVRLGEITGKKNASKVFTYFICIIICMAKYLHSCIKENLFIHWVYYWLNSSFQYKCNIFYLIWRWCWDDDDDDEEAEE